jgi:hypothetical protein
MVGLVWFCGSASAQSSKPASMKSASGQMSKDWSIRGTGQMLLAEDSYGAESTSACDYRDNPERSACAASLFLIDLLFGDVLQHEAGKLGPARGGVRFPATRGWHRDRDGATTEWPCWPAETPHP